jgi:hypothetical protein
MGHFAALSRANIWTGLNLESNERLFSSSACKIRWPQRQILMADRRSVSPESSVKIAGTMLLRPFSRNNTGGPAQERQIVTVGFRHCK